MSSDQSETQERHSGKLEGEAREQGPAGNVSASDVGSRILGQLVALLTQSPNHRHLFLSDLEWMIVPPLARRQMRLFQDEKGPIAFATWASVSEEVEKDLVAGRQRLKPSEWKSGDRLWLIDLVCPAATANPKIMNGLLNELAQKVFKNKSCKIRIADPKTGKMKIGTMNGEKVVN